MNASIRRLRTRIKRLARRTICFSKAIEMHDERDWFVYQPLRVWTRYLTTAYNTSEPLPRR
ncbi:MAG: IS1 family transposase [Gloeocapsa sp. UFS-A4-WI-NPMV-4B04]|nr:IS1 family transposase [Gloeocapsa sp. UFS-A4-WI-NPMV-4B04]